MKYSKQDIENANLMLRQYLPKGATVHCVLRGVSRSGMQRRIDFYAIDTSTKGKPRLQYLSGWIAVLLGMSRQDRGLKVNGCGMDMGFHMVDTLASALYGRTERGLGIGLRSEWV